MKYKGIKQFYSLVIIFAMMFTMMMPIRLAYAVGAISASLVANPANASVDPSIVVTLAGDTFTGTGISDIVGSWTIGLGTTGLTVGTFTLTDTTHMTIAFTGTAAAGTISIQAKAAALTLNAASNSINVDLPAITTVSTIANDSANPTLVVKLVGDTFSAGATTVNNWSFTYATGLTGVSSIAINGVNNQATITFIGTATDGTATVKANAAALTGAAQSNILSVEVPVISAPTIANGVAAPTLVVTLVGDTYAAGATVVGNWNFTYATGLTGVSSIALNAAKDQATITFVGTATDGTATIRATGVALTGTKQSNVLSVEVPVISAPTIANGVAAPTLVVTLVGDTFAAGATTEGNWNFTYATGLIGVGSIALNAGNDQATITFIGTATAGTATVRATGAALTGTKQSNTISVGVPVISSASTIINGTVTPIVSVSLVGDTYAGGATTPSNWSFIYGATSLTANTITLNAGNDTATITFTGKAAAGTITIQAKGAALSGAVQSNSITLVIPAVTIASTGPAIANAATNPSITVTLTDANFAAAATSQLLSSWSINVGNTGLTVNTITRDNNTQATITFIGVSSAGTITVQAKAAAHTGSGVSNSISVVVPGIPFTIVAPDLSTTPTIGVPSPMTITSYGTSNGNGPFVWNWTGVTLQDTTGTTPITIPYTHTAGPLASPDDMTITPNKILDFGKTYTLTISAGAVSDKYLNTNSLFTLPLTTPPVGITAIDLTANEAGVIAGKVIKLTTNVVSTLDTTLFPITLVDTNGGSCTVTYVQSGKDITVVPTDMLSSGSTYTLTVPIGALKDSTGLKTNGLCTINFSTAYNLDLLIKNSYGSVTFNTLMATNSPRGINVSVPKRYLTKFEIAYSTVGFTDPLTNVDITSETEVAKINVYFGTGSTTPVSAVKRTTTTWNTGYSGSLTTLDDKGAAIGQDITFEALDKYDRLLEKKKIIQLNVKGNKVDLSATKKLTAKKTFADLILNNGKALTDILKYYVIDELTLSVAPVTP